MSRRRRKKLDGWGDDARTAITTNPDYFVWWYTAKSIGLAVLFAAFAYHLGRAREREALANK